MLHLLMTVVVLVVLEVVVLVVALGVVEVVLVCEAESSLLNIISSY